MSSISITADTYNLFPASPANHVIRFERMPHLSFVVQEVNLPAVTTNIPRIQTGGPWSKFMPERLNFDPLAVTFIVDEEFRAYRELYSWLWGMTGGTDRSEITTEFINEQAQNTWTNPRNKESALASSAQTSAGLTIVNGSKIPILRVLFYNVLLTGLGAIQFSTTSDTLPPITTTATFEYDFYTIVELRR